MYFTWYNVFRRRFFSWFGPTSLKVADHCCRRSNKWVLFSLAGYSFFLVCDTLPSICWGNWTLVFPYETGALTNLPWKCWVLSLCVSGREQSSLYAELNTMLWRQVGVVQYIFILSPTLSHQLHPLATLLMEKESRVPTR